MKLNEVNTPYFKRRPKDLADAQKYGQSGNIVPPYYMVSNISAHRYSVVGKIDRIIKGNDISEAQAVSYWNRKVQQHLRQAFPRISRVDINGLGTQLFDTENDRNKAIHSDTVRKL